MSPASKGRVREREGVREGGEEEGGKGASSHEKEENVHVASLEEREGFPRLLLSSFHLPSLPSSENLHYTPFFPNPIQRNLVLVLVPLLSPPSVTSHLSFQNSRPDPPPPLAPFWFIFIRGHRSIRRRARETLWDRSSSRSEKW